MYVSRGGIKLEHALKEFKVDVLGRICLDIGASTGGFTDCLLQHGAAKVYAVDVGYGILAWKLRQDPRVVVVERTNARYLMPDELYFRKSKVESRESKIGGKAVLATMDVSFISLSKIFPAVYNLLEDHGEVVALIKPQFEARREEVGRGGIVRDEEVRKRVVEKIKKEAEAEGFGVKGVTPSPIKGAEGNVEIFVYLNKE
jgi:23S rRNA (cytidine1920-2'-O)/16S rRNA (cytidine1409-2'-O)-methyltransferase